MFNVRLNALYWMQQKKSKENLCERESEKSEVEMNKIVKVQ